MSVEYVIICDGCGRTIAGSAAAAHVARLDVQANGGKTGLPGGRDLATSASMTSGAPATRGVAAYDTAPDVG